ncbi:MFS transporter [Bacillus mycoides]
MSKRLELLYLGYITVFKNKFYRRLFLINLFMTILNSMMIPVFPLWILKVVNLSPASIFFILGITGIGSSILNIFIGYLTDIIGKRKLMLELKLALSCLRGLLFSFFPFTPIIIVTNCVTQLSSGSLIFAILADKIKDNNDEENKGLISSTIRAGVSLGFIFGPFIGTLIVSLVTYYYFFIIFSFLNLLLLVATHYCINDTNKKKTLTNNKDRCKRDKNKQPIKLFLITFLPICLFIGNQTSGTLLSLLVNSISNQWMLAIIFGIGPLFEIIAFPLVGSLTDKWGTSKAVLSGILCEILYFTVLGVTNNIWIVLVVQVLGAFYVAVIFNSLMLYIQERFENRIGFSSSLYFSSISISSTIGNVLIGSLMLNMSYSFGFLVLGITTTLGFLIFIILESNIIIKLNRKKATYKH